MRTRSFFSTVCGAALFLFGPLIGIQPAHSTPLLDYVSFIEAFQEQNSFFPSAVFLNEGKTDVAKEDWICAKDKEASAETSAQVINQAILNRQPGKGALLTGYFPPHSLKSLLLSPSVAKDLQALIFLLPSFKGRFFSFEERVFLHDLWLANISVYWIDENTQETLQYIERPHEVCGLFVPLNQAEAYQRGTLIGVYGSHMSGKAIEGELKELLLGLQALSLQANHPLLNPQRPLILLTGGGPGAMEAANKAAKAAGILSAARMVDFSAFMSEAHHNPYVEARMTYQMSEMIHRQADFHLDFPIFVRGGIGTDFELALEEAERKVNVSHPTPVILLDSPSYWEKKISSRFQCNREAGTIKGGEWISNCFICVQSAQEALEVYRAFIGGQLVIGKKGPLYARGFCIWTEDYSHLHQ